MALTHALFLSFDHERWLDLARRVLALIAKDLHVTILESGAITTAIDAIQISATSIDRENASSLAEDIGFPPTGVFNFRAPGEQSYELDVFCLRIAARCIRTNLATNVGLCRNFDSKFLIQTGAKIRAFGLDTLMHEALTEELGEQHGFEITVERWLE